MSAPIRIGLLGASKIALAAILAPVRADGRFRVAAVAARDPARARAYAEAHAVGVVAAGYADLVARVDVDVVYNALPPAGHAEWTIAALGAGKAVLCEKPLARDATEARIMVETARAARRPLLEAFHYRFHGVMRRAEALVASSAIGALTSGTAEFHVPIARTAGELRWSAPQGGGALMDLGCYPLHALRTLFRAEPSVTSASAVFEAGVDAELQAELEFPGGRPARIACSMTAPRAMSRLRLEGQRGRLEIVNFVAPQMGCRVLLTIDGVTTAQPADGRTTYAAQLDHLYAVLRNGAAPLTGGDDAVANMVAIDAIYAAARAR